MTSLARRHWPSFGSLRLRCRSRSLPPSSYEWDLFSLHLTTLDRLLQALGLSFDVTDWALTLEPEAQRRQPSPKPDHWLRAAS